jgi:hypothetical protein
MRDDEDNIRQYLPVLRRIIILVAVLTAIPAVMWTITAFVRNHIGPPRAPALQPMAIAPANRPASTTATAADQSAAPTADTAQEAPPNASANAGTADAAAAPAPHTGGAATPADATPTGATPAFRTASVTPSNAAPDAAPPDATPPAATPPAASNSADDAAPNPADSAAPSQSPDNGTQVAARPQASVWPATPTGTADTLPAGEPISGPVPLPRKRPTAFAMAGNVPLPAPRPDAAGAGPADSSPTAIDWLKKVFHPSTAPAPSSDGVDDTAHE